MFSEKYMRNMRNERARSGGQLITSNGYRLLDLNGKFVREHRHVVEKVLKRKLPRTVIVHHINEDKLDNSKGNLVVCQDKDYHKLLHEREHALQGPYLPI